MFLFTELTGNKVNFKTKEMHITNLHNKNILSLNYKNVLQFGLNNKPGKLVIAIQIKIII